MYRVFGCAGSAGDDVVLAAMLMAAADGADVISMSLGSLSPDEVDNPYQELTETLTQRGIAVIVAAGNDGDLGEHTFQQFSTHSYIFQVHFRHRRLR